MESIPPAPARKPRDTFSIIHDDEFRPLNADELETAKFQHDVLDWQDTWKGRPAPEVFRNQIRLGSQLSTRPND
jgi:hypothetical protein